jgi:hypothetical protein
MAGVRLAALLAVALLGGCAGKAGPQEPPAAAVLDDGMGAGTLVAGLLGVVVDAAIRPVPNATVVLDGKDVSRTTSSDGSFSFLDLAPGAYLVKVDVEPFQPQQVAVELASGAISQVRIVLELDASRLPYNTTFKMDGFADLTAAPFVGGILYDAAHAEGVTLCQCSFTVNLEPGAGGFILEAVMSDCADGAPTCFWNGFSYEVRNDEDGEVAGDETASGNNPLWVRVTGASPNATEYSLMIVPNTDPVPEASKHFQVFVTFFYRADPPEGFRIVPAG